jgi:hypothetical protein
VVASVSEQFQAIHVRPAPGPALVIGSKVFAGRADRRALFPDALGLDLQPGDGVDIVHDLTQPYQGRFNHIDCVSVLEHCAKPWVVAENIQAVMAPAATIFLSVPFAHRWHGYPSDYFRFTAEGVRALFPLIVWEVMKYGHRKLTDPGQKLPCEKIDDLPYLPRCEVLAFGRLA